MRDHKGKKKQTMSISEKNILKKGSSKYKGFGRGGGVWWWWWGGVCGGVSGTAAREPIVKNSLISPANRCRAFKVKEEIQLGGYFQFKSSQTLNLILEIM